MRLKWWLKQGARFVGVGLLGLAGLVVWMDPDVVFLAERDALLLTLGVLAAVLFLGLLLYLRIADYSGWNDVSRPPDLGIPLNHEESDSSFTETREELRGELRGVVVRELVHRGLDREEAVDAVGSGGWTDDRRAAWWVDEDAPHPSKAVMVLDWLSPEGFRERYFRHALREIEGLVGDD